MLCIFQSMGGLRAAHCATTDGRVMQWHPGRLTVIPDSPLAPEKIISQGRVRLLAPTFVPL